jgi:hypothetical protein
MQIRGIFAKLMMLIVVIFSELNESLWMFNAKRLIYGSYFTE